MISEEDVKKNLGIDNFRNLPKDKIMEFVSCIPNMDKDVAIKVIEQFPSYIELETNIIKQLNLMCENILKENSISQKDSIEAYKKILNDLGELLKKDNISSEERTAITDKMIEIADKIALKDTENKNFLSNIMKYNNYVSWGALLLGAVILGVNVKGTKIPTLKK